jgi:hypothetical protein
MLQNRRRRAGLWYMIGFLSLPVHHKRLRTGTDDGQRGAEPAGGERGLKRQRANGDPADGARQRELYQVVPPRVHPDDQPNPDVQPARSARSQKRVSRTRSGR